MKITCTRCLGKGFVDIQDIKRLGKFTEWIDNSVCTFCLGKGTISEKFASKHNPDSEKFPNVEDYSGLINFSNLSEEQKNKRFEEALERTGGDINFDEEDELTTKSQFKTIFWSSLISIVLTLSVVLYFSGEFNKQDESDFSNFFRGLGIITILGWFPATIIYRLMFGKIESEVAKANHLYYITALSLFAIFLTLTGNILVKYVTPGYFLGGITVLISILITRFFLKWIFSKNK